MLSIVIPTYQRADLLLACLTAATRHAPPETEIIVADDASPGNACVAVIRQFPQAQILRLPQRSGFAAAANAGIRASRGAIIELLNDDTEVQPGWATAALACFDDPQVGAVAPLVLSWPDGRRIDSAGDDYHPGGFASKRGHGKRNHESWQREVVFGASASSAFYRRSALERTGLFPESFGSYFEDVDLAYRLRSAGFQTIFEPASRVLHHGGASHGPPRRRLLEQQSRNEELVFWRNVPDLLRSLPLHLAVLAGKALRRCQEGTLMPWLLGRINAWRCWREVRQHRLHARLHGSKP